MSSAAARRIESVKTTPQVYNTIVLQQEQLDVYKASKCSRLRQYIQGSKTLGHHIN